MYCPRCANGFQKATAYCRSCGLSLDGVSRIVTGEAASAPALRRSPNSFALRTGLALFLIGTVLGLANLIVRELGIFPEIYGKIVFLTFVALGLLAMGASVVFPSKTYVKPKFGDKARGLETAPLPEQLAAPGINSIDDGFLNKDRASVSVEPGSVTENTTRQLR
ncbi:MAG: hypothetical protein ABI857_06285 [Acidobacteriota bacterium]